MQGPKGLPGPPGLNGSKGDTGQQGAQGPIRKRGLQGDKGEPGVQGDRGANGTFDRLKNSHSCYVKCYQNILLYWLYLIKIEKCIMHLS